jgi:hypothetical protein
MKAMITNTSRENVELYLEELDILADHKQQLKGLFDL